MGFISYYSIKKTHIIFFVLIFIVLFITSLLQAEQALSIYTQNSECLLCHGPGGGTTSEVDFVVSPKATYANCGKCHNYQNHPYWAQTYYPAFGGYFKTNPAVIIFNPEVFHKYHSGGKASYLRGAYGSGYTNCRSCHERVSCEACHSSVNHNTHGQTTYSGPALFWTEGYPASAIIENLNCTAANCHGYMPYLAEDSTINQPADTSSFKPEPQCLGCHSPAEKDPFGVDRADEHGYEASLHQAGERHWCEACHYIELGPEHFKETSLTTSDEDINCNTCHQSIVTSIEPWDKTCGQCHNNTYAPNKHPDEESAHDASSEPKATGCLGDGCHGSDVRIIHGTQTSYEVCVACHAIHDTYPGCVACHSKIEIPQDLDCTRCHSFNHQAGHNLTFFPTGSSGCGDCHQENAVTEHTVNHNINCSSCHQSTEPVIQAAMDKGLTGNPVYCDDCHPGAGEHLSQHDKTRTPSSDCNICHDQNVATEHTINQPLTCQTCHSSTSQQVKDAIASGMDGNLVYCQACHSEADSNMHADQHEQAQPPAVDCQACHDENFVTEHLINRGKSCSSCHQSTDPAVQAAVISGMAGNPIDCEDCHEITNHGSPPTNDDCLNCHVPGGPVISEVDFVVSPKATFTNCGKCHNYQNHPYWAQTYYPAYGGYFKYDPQVIMVNPEVFHKYHSGGKASFLRGAYGSGYTNCASCHQRVSCEACHTSVNHNTHGHTIYSGPTLAWTDGYPASAIIENINCSTAECHGYMPYLAQDSTVNNSEDTGTFKAEPKCLTCHSPASKDPFGVDRTEPHGYKAELHQATIDLICKDCHESELGPEHDKSTSQTSTGDPILCITCHQTLVPELKAQGGWQKSCDECHEQSGHAGIVTGVHLSYCNECHTTSLGEEEKCFQCHPSSGTAYTWNGRFIEQEFNRNSKHDIFSATGAKIECASCHYSHNVLQVNTTSWWQANRVSNPDNTKQLFGAVDGSTQWIGTFCLKCHDSSPPVRSVTASVLVPYTIKFPDMSTYPFFPGWDKSLMTTSGHWDNTASTDRPVRCDNCHDPHGSDNKRLVAFTGGHFPPQYRGNEINNDEEELCYRCHDWQGMNCTSLSMCHDTNMVDMADTLKIFFSDAWATSSVYDANDRVNEVVIGDIDGDNDLDSVSANSDTVLSWHENTSGDGNSWSTKIIFDTAVGYLSAALGDIDGDGDLDVVASNGSYGSMGSIAWYENVNGDGSSWTYQNITILGSSVYPYTLDVGDIDGDNDQDIVTGLSTDSVYLYKNNNGVGTSWVGKLVNTTGNDVESVKLGDLDGDNDLDIASGSRDSNVYFHNNSSGDGSSWSTTIINDTGDGIVYSIDIGDLDGDNDLDIASGTAWTGTGWSVFYHKNDKGDASSWNTATLFSASSDVRSVDIGDLDNDSDLDVVSGDGSRVYYHENLDKGKYWEASAVFTSGIVRSIDTADINGDNNGDIISGGDSTLVNFHENKIDEQVYGSHPVGKYSGRHSDTEGPDELGAANRHVECVDCHNPHLATRTMASAPNASGYLAGVGGVQVTNGTAGTIPAYTALNSIIFQYQLCFKCHSSYATDYTGDDKAVEFNTNNPSYHPVEDIGKNTTINAAAFVAPWTATSIMYCTNCHGGDSSISTKGPHGSNNEHILVRPTYQNSAGTGPPRFVEAPADDLCYQCHEYSVYHDGANGSRFGDATYSSLHQVHVANDYPGINDSSWGCTVCHETHGKTNYLHLIRDKMPSQVGGNNMNYTSSVTGGSCAPTYPCHGPRSYTHQY